MTSKNTAGLFVREMDIISEIAKRRSLPGTLIFNMRRRLLFYNREAVEIIPDLPAIYKKGEGTNVTRSILQLYDEFIKVNGGKSASSPAISRSKVLELKTGLLYLVRAFFIRNASEKELTHVAIIVEKIIKNHNFNFEKVRRNYKLSGREMEVLILICQGFPNKEISEKLFISEYTVKDHIKHILRKIGVKSRNQIISTIK